MNEEELRLVYNSVVLAKILYASPAWWGFTSAAEKQRIEAFVRRGVRLGLSRASDLHTLTQLIADNDDNLSRKTLYSEHHILKKRLPDEKNHHYHDRQRRQYPCLGLTVKIMTVIRQLFKDLYW